MATNDIVARLQLRAEQFTSETGKAFAEMRTRAATTAQEIRGSFNSTFAQVQQLAANALKIAPTSTGALDLSADIAQLRGAAAAADQRAASLRELSLAADRAASAEGVNTQQLRLNSDAAAVGALEAEKAAQGYRSEALGLEAMQRELNQGSVAAQRLGQANERAAAGAAAHRFGVINLGQQVGDFATQALTGGNIATAFAQQAGQAGFAMSQMGGAAGKVGAFLTGPWGIAFTIAASAAALLLPKLLENNTALDDEKKKLDATATAADSLGAAQSLLGKIVDLTTGKFKTQNAELIESIKLQAQLAILKAKQDQIDAGKALAKSATNTTPGRVAGYANFLFTGDESNVGPTPALDKLNQSFATFIDLAANAKTTGAQLGAGLKTAETAVDAYARAAQIGGVKTIELKRQLLDLANARGTQHAFQEALDVANGGKVPADLVPYKRDPKPKKPPSQEGLISFGESATQEIARVNAEWDETPKLIDKANLATLQLDTLIAKLERRKPPGFEKLIADARAAQGVIQDGLQRPYNDFIKAQNDAYQVQALMVSGRVDEANALKTVISLEKTMGPLTAAQKDNVLGTVEALRAQQRELAAAQAKTQVYLTELGNIRSAVEGAFTGGLKGIKDLPKNLISAFAQARGQQIFERLFGQVFRDLQDQVSGVSTVKDASERMATAMDSVKTHLTELGNAAAAATTRLSGAGGATPANDNSPTANVLDAAGNIVGSFTAPAAPQISGADQAIEIVGNKLHDPLSLLSSSLQKMAEGVGISPAGAKTIGSIGGKAIQGAAEGALTNSVFAPIAKGLGLKTSNTGAQIGGAIGSAIPIPGASEIGSIIGSIVGGLFKKTPYGGTTITYNETTKGLVAGETFGNSKKAEAAAGQAGDSVVAGLTSILKQLGGTLVSAPDITIGQRHGDYRVNTGGTSLKIDGGAIEFDEDGEAAVAYAIKEELARAVISGISQASINILHAGKDLQASIEKAALIESVPKDLKALLDPVGAAVDNLNRKFADVVAAMKEGGATAEQLAQAQQLYSLQLDQTKASTAAADATLKDFLLSLKIGSDSPLSLRDQEATAKATLQPFLDAISGGKAIDQGKYQDAAQSFLDVERKLYGSTDQYFTAFDQIQSFTNKAIETIDKAVPIAGTLPTTTDPFAATTATNTGTANEILGQMNGTLANLPAAIAAQLARYFAAGGAGGFASGAFGRNFAAA